MQSHDWHSLLSLLVNSVIFFFFLLTSHWGSNAEWNEMEREVERVYPHLLESWHAANDNGLRRVCLCRRVSRPGQLVVQCEQCCEWFHPACLRLPASAAAAGACFVCPSCRAIPEEPLAAVPGFRFCDCLTYTRVAGAGARVESRDVPLPAAPLQAHLAVFRLPPGHPAHSPHRPSRGVRARRPLPRGATLAFYAGEVVPHASGRGYDFALNAADADGPCVDAARQGNATRFLNHSAAAPNCRAVHDGGALIRLVASRDIASGQELLLNYGAQFWPAQQCADP